MPVRAVCNFIYFLLIPRDASAEEREKFDDELYEPLGGYRPLSLMGQIGG